MASACLDLLCLVLQRIDRHPIGEVDRAEVEGFSEAALDRLLEHRILVQRATLDELDGCPVQWLGGKPYLFDLEGERAPEEIDPRLLISYEIDVLALCRALRRTNRMDGPPADETSPCTHFIGHRGNVGSACPPTSPGCFATTTSPMSSGAFGLTSGQGLSYCSHRVWSSCDPGRTRSWRGSRACASAPRRARPRCAGTICPQDPSDNQTDIGCAIGRTAADRCSRRACYARRQGNIHRQAGTRDSADVGGRGARPERLRPSE